MKEKERPPSSEFCRCFTDKTDGEIQGCHLVPSCPEDGCGGYITDKMLIEYWDKKKYKKWKKARDKRDKEQHKIVKDFERKEKEAKE